MLTNQFNLGLEPWFLFYNLRLVGESLLEYHYLFSSLDLSIRKKPVTILLLTKVMARSTSKNETSMKVETLSFTMKIKNTKNREGSFGYRV